MAAPAPLSLKLLIDPKSNTLLFAEAGKDFVDFLFNIMSLPVATIITLLSKKGTAGCTGNIYDSIEKLGDSSMLSSAKKDMLLKPMVANYDSNVARLLPRPQSSYYTNLYRCEKNEFCSKFVTNYPNTTCPSCNGYGIHMSENVAFVNPTNTPSYSSERGFVKGGTTFMIMDDLVVRLMTTQSMLTMFNKFNIKDVSSLEEKVVGVGPNEGVELLRALMQSKTVLTDVLLAEKKDPSVKPE